MAEACMSIVSINISDICFNCTAMFEVPMMKQDMFWELEHESDE
jgi:hypothetical protein